jgi:NADH:ubiquinone oxidoreductase subunit F (NADH-binding)/NADH:ubiquinone oxidoreductase subunit E
MAEGRAEVRRHSHPGRGGRASATPKGRQVDPEAHDRVLALLGDAPRRRDRLIEHLHKIQDVYGYLSAAHLVALAAEMKMALTEVYEVATFYAHFDVVDEGQAPPPPITVRVCDSIACAMAGAEDLLKALDGSLGGDVRVLRAPCMGGCDRAPVAAIGHNAIDHVTPDVIRNAVRDKRTQPAMPPYVAYDRYVADGGYRLLRDCLANTRTPDDIIKVLDDAGLRGLGGAGFPSGRKWKIVRDYPEPRLMAVNGDEGEPGTFKDRWFLETDPHRFLEGMLIAAWAVGIEGIYVYLRDEYPAARHILEHELARLEKEGLVAHGRVQIRRGAGAYICGEESAMLESIEGKRGLPRHKPPFPAEVGLFGKPTLCHNVETLWWVRDLFEKGAAWFSGQGRNGRKGLRSFSVSGRVKDPGVKIAPAGISVRELIDEFCGGMAPGHNFKGYLPGGASGGILPARMGDLPLDFGTLEQHGALIGSAAVVVLSDKDSAADVALNLMRFFEDESCGQCTPCRAGCEKAVKLMERKSWDKPLLDELTKTMMDASICGLGQAAPNGLLTAFRYFPDDIPKT